MFGVLHILHTLVKTKSTIFPSGSIVQGEKTGFCSLKIRTRTVWMFRKRQTPNLYEWCLDWFLSFFTQLDVCFMVFVIQRKPNWLNHYDSRQSSRSNSIQLCVECWTTNNEHWTLNITSIHFTRIDSKFECMWNIENWVHN